jgi:hypothetical protein
MKIDLGKKQNSRYFAPKKSKDINEKFVLFGTKK